ncbi:hypothetical protein C5167_001682 [Papaver somniferum]|uniref:Uncharacterized protein n=1 Tax=Papaver somniferum TaxID=3469 RepID=A0A4Y7KZW5_PAPSO|nr:hypothetical protein C5167_001682 [Papaver somniferum]
MVGTRRQSLRKSKNQTESTSNISQKSAAEIQKSPKAISVKQNKSIGKEKNASSKEENELVLPDSLVSKIKESHYGKLFMMFWDTNYTRSHWEKLDDALTKMIKCYRWVEDDNVIQFEFERNRKIHVLNSTPEEPWFAEHTHCVKPLELPEGSNLPRVARWNIKEIAMEFTKDIKMAEYQIISWP